MPKHLHLEDGEVDESTVRRTTARVEDALIKSGKFSWPGRKALRESKQSATAAWPKAHPRRARHSQLKPVRVPKETQRHRRRRFALRLNLVAAPYNHGLTTLWLSPEVYWVKHRRLLEPLGCIPAEYEQGCYRQQSQAAA